jgi:hypothetical protein
MSEHQHEFGLYAVPRAWVRPWLWRLLCPRWWSPAWRLPVLWPFSVILTRRVRDGE